MDVRVCKKCRRLFNYIYGPEFCPECINVQCDIIGEEKNSGMIAEIKPLDKKEEDIYEQVKEYILGHPKSTVAHIVDVFGISPSVLFDWIRDDRLEFTDEASSAWFTCEKCGVKIRSGRFCGRCRTR